MLCHVFAKCTLPLLDTPDARAESSRRHPHDAGECDTGADHGPFDGPHRTGSIGRGGVLSAPGASSSGGAAAATAAADEQRHNEHCDAADRDEGDQALGVNEQFRKADGLCGLHFVIRNG
jgi:hypothetical protein